jgi:hypothetical protein
MSKFSLLKKALSDCANETQKVIKPLGEKISTIDTNSLKNSLCDCYAETITAMRPLSEKISQFDEEIFKSSCKDIAGILSKICVGYVPLVGPIFSEIVGSCLQKQEMDKVFNYMHLLESRLSFIENKENIPTLTGFQDLIVESCRQASEAIHEKRQEYIASIVTTGISRDSEDLTRVMRLLETFKSLKDTELEILKMYGDPSAGSTEFNSDTLSHAVQFSSDDDGIEKEVTRNSALYAQYIDHLKKLDLLQSKGDSFHDSSFHSMNEDYMLTRSGENLLMYMGA